MEALILLTGEGETFTFGSSTSTMKATSDMTGGAFSISEASLAPGFPGPPAHSHERTVDSFYVLEGILTVLLGDEQLRVASGGYVCVPPRVVHTFSNSSDAPVRFLNINSPAGWESYLRELSAAIEEAGGPEPQAMARVMSRHDFVLHH